MHCVMRGLQEWAKGEVVCTEPSPASQPKRIFSHPLNAALDRESKCCSSLSLAAGRRTYSTHARESEEERYTKLSCRLAASSFPHCHGRDPEAAVAVVVLVGVPGSKALLACISEAPGAPEPLTADEILFN